MDWIIFVAVPLQLYDKHTIKQLPKALPVWIWASVKKQVWT